MARKGPLTRNTSTVPLGLAQVRVGKSSTSTVASLGGILSSTNSIGALATTKYIGNIEYWRLESGFPLLEDYVVPLRASAALECAFKEVYPFTMALAMGIDPLASDSTPDSSAGYYPPTNAIMSHSGEVALGALSAAAYIRMEAFYAYPSYDTDGDSMTIIFPRAQVAASVEMDLQVEDSAAIPITFESKRADSDVTGGNAVWDDMPLGRIFWQTTRT